MKRICLLLLPVLLLAGCGGTGKQAVEQRVMEAVAAYEASPGVQLRVSVREETGETIRVQNEGTLWICGDDWLQETQVASFEGTVPVITLQYAGSCLQYANDRLTRSETPVDGIGAVQFDDVDSYSLAADGSCVARSQHKLSKEQRQKGIKSQTVEVELNPQGELIRITNRRDYGERGAQVQEVKVVSWDAAACEEKIQAAWDRFAAETPPE